MLIKESSLKHWIKNFYGYGSWDARVWFIGHEENGGDYPVEVAEKLNYFDQQQPSNEPPRLCDIRELYKQVTFQGDGPRANLYSNLFHYRFGPNAVLHGTWKNIIAFVHGYQNKSLPDLHQYQQNSFALPTNNSEALLQLYPLPAHNHAWYYPWLDLPELPFLRTRTAYQEFVYPERINHLLTKISNLNPEVVVMYGMENINTLKASVSEFFPSVNFKQVKAEKMSIPQHHQARIGETILILTTQVPALKHNRIETGFDWYTFGKTILSQK